MLIRPELKQTDNQFISQLCKTIITEDNKTIKNTVTGYHGMVTTDTGSQS